MLETVLVPWYFDLFLTVCGTLGGLPLATTTSHTDTVDNVSLLGLVSETAGLVRAGRTGCAVDDIELAKLQVEVPSAKFNG
jgi:hypothetical protein